MKKPQELTHQNLQSLTPKALKATYQDVVGYPPPKNSRAPFLIHNILWCQQAKLQGDKPDKLRLALIKQCTAATKTARPKYKAGTRLVRQWGGDSYEVIVTETGYRWRDQDYKSLSPIANQITGTRWSGPRFFGLKEAAA